jgi:hypothetical protein
MPFPGINNEDHRLGFRPTILDLIFESHNQKYSSPMISSPLAKTTTASPQRLETHEEHVPHSTFCNQYSSPSLSTSSRSHHDFLHRYQFHETVQKIPPYPAGFFFTARVAVTYKNILVGEWEFVAPNKDGAQKFIVLEPIRQKNKLCLAAGWTNAF